MTYYFNRCISVILRSEGGFVNNSDDRGGPTNMGITQATYDSWKKGQASPQRELFPKSVQLLGVKEAKEIYYDFYWLRGRCEAMEWPLNLVHFDGTVNHGVRRANILLQETIVVGTDGVIGPITMEAIEGRNPLGISESLLWRRLSFYIVLAEKLSQTQFLKGWINRLVSLRKEFAF